MTISDIYFRYSLESEFIFVSITLPKSWRVKNERMNHVYERRRQNKASKHTI